MAKVKPTLSVEDLEATETKYRELSQMIQAAEGLPTHVRSCKLQAPPFIPAEFRKSKIPSNLFFTSYEFTIYQMAQQLKELKEIVGSRLPNDVRSDIDKGN